MKNDPLAQPMGTDIGYKRVKFVAIEKRENARQSVELRGALAS